MPSAVPRALDARVLAGLLLALTAYRLWMIASAPYTLSVDEAQYWTWAQDLAGGYYSKPPVIAWGLAAATALAGDSEFGVRFLSALLFVATALVLVAIARELGARAASGWAGLAFATLPGVSHYARAMTVDAWLLLFWALALLFLLRALRTGRWRDWLLAGAAAGLGLMSKYTMGAFGMLAGAWLLTSPALRARWRDPRLWAAVLLALTIFAPNLAWNLANGFPTLRHTAEISGLGQAGLRPGEALEFITGQWAYMGPLLGLLGVVAWWRALRDRGRDAGESALLWFSLPLIAFVALMGLFGRALANWAAPATLAWTLLTVLWLVRSGRHRLLAAAIAINLLALLPIHHFDALARLAGFTLDARSDPYKRVRGWDVFGAEVRALANAHPQATLLVDTRELAAQAAFYARIPMDRIRIWNPLGRVDNHYQLVASLREPDGGRYLYLGRCVLPEGLRPAFGEYRRMEDIRVPIHADYAIGARVALLAGRAAERGEQAAAARSTAEGAHDGRDAQGNGSGRPDAAYGTGQGGDACLFR